MLMLPEIIVISTAIALIVLDLFLTERSRAMLAPLCMAGLAAALGALMITPTDGELFGGRFAMDAIAWWFKLIFLLTAIITVVLSRDLLDGYAKVRMRGIGFRGEYYAILLFTITGMLYLVSARDTITLYVSLELATIPLFVLAAWQRHSLQSGEAGLKYILLGALSSAFILYGLSLFYGITGSTDLHSLAHPLARGLYPVFILAVTMLMAGIGFKLTIVPFHMWAADVYEGAPMPVTAYLSVASKAAGLAFMFQILYRVLGLWLESWMLPIAILAALTMTLGNVVAIVQQNIKRFMAFSSISQAGYFILGFLNASSDGVPAMLFYMLVYLLSNLAVFACIVWYANETGYDRIEDYRGLSRTNPLMALAMMIALFSLAGIPPLSGFVGKFFLFRIAAEAHLNWLVAVAAVNSTISLYYYLRIVRQMYIEPIHPEAVPLRVPRTMGFTVAALSAAVILLGIIPFFYETIHAGTIHWVVLVRALP